MKRFLATVIICAFFLTLPASTQAQSKHALGTIAVSPDNSTLVAAGYNRVMYVCDPADLSVKERIFLEIIPSDASFTSDGKSLVIVSSDRFVNIYDTATWKKKAEILKAQDVSFAHDTNEMVVMHTPVYKDKKRFSPVAVYDMSTGEKKRDASFEIEGYAIGTNLNGSQTVLMSRPKTDETETKEKTPKELKDLERAEFELKHDGRTAEVLWLNGDLKETARHKTWYSDSGTNHIFVKDGVATHLVYRNRCATFTPDGEATLFKTGTSFNYGMGVSRDMKTIAAGGLATGMVMDAATKTSISFKHSRLPGFPEYFYGFAIGPDGTIYGGTSAWRIVKVSPEGKVLSETPIF